MRWIDMTAGGWQGWHFGPWGRAKEWRLHAPDGTSYTMDEIDYMRRRIADYHYLQGRVRELEEKLDANPLVVSGEEMQTLHAAAMILDKALKDFCENKNRRARYEKIIAYNNHLSAFLDAHRRRSVRG